MNDNTLILNIGRYTVGQGELGKLEFTINPEQVALFASGDLIGINLPGKIKYVPRNVKPIQPFYPQIIELHGTLYQGQHSTGGLGATLAPPQSLSFSQPNSDELVVMTFMCTRRYLQEMEDQRARQPGSNMTLGFSIQGLAAVIAPVSALSDVLSTEENSHQQDLQLGDGPRMLLGQIAPIVSASQGADYFTVSRSRWSDELKKLGFPQHRSIDLPTIDAENSLPEMRLAAQHLIAAHGAFLGDDPRKAVQLCRQARDALLPGETLEQRKNWALEHFTPAIGKAKALMIYQSVDALRSLGNSASHGTEENVAVEIDREAAEYVIGQITLILHYLDRKLR